MGLTLSRAGRANTLCGIAWRSLRGAIDMRLLVAALVCAATADAGALRDERRSNVFCAAARRRNARAVKMSIRKGVDVEYP